MEERKFVETVVARVHAMTLNSGKESPLQWKVESKYAVAEPLNPIRVSLYYSDVAPDSAVWDRVVIKSPVGNSVVLVNNPAANASLGNLVPISELALKHINELFSHVVLEPRRKEFDAAMQRFLGN